MSEYGGSFRIKAGIDIKETERGLRQLEGLFKSTMGKIGNLRNSLNKPITNTAINDALLKTEKEIDRTEQAIARLHDRMSKGTNEGAIEKLSEQLRVAQGESERLWENAARIENELKEMGGNDLKLDRDLLQVTGEADKADQKISDLKKKIEELSAAGDAFRGSEQFRTMQAEEQLLSARLDDLFNKEKKAASGATDLEKKGKKALKNIGDSAKKHSKGLDAFGKRILGLAKRVFIFSVIARAFRSMVAAMKEGFQNFAKYSGELNAAMSAFKSSTATFKNQLGAMVAPILNAIVPALTTLINYLSKAAQYVTMLFAALSGKGTWSRAVKQQKDYAKSLDGTAGSAKKAAGALASFDELAVLNEQDSGGGGGEDAAAMFEEMAVPSSTLSALDKLKQRLAELKALFKQGFFDGLGDIAPRMETIRKGLEQIKTAAKDIFTDSEVVGAANRWIDSLAYSLGAVSGSMASIGLTIAANLIGGIGQYLEEATPRIKDTLTQLFNINTETNYLVAEAAIAGAQIFEAFASPNGVDLTANIIGIFASAFGGLALFVSQAMRDIVQLITKPFVDNAGELQAALDNTLGIFASVFGAIRAFVENLADSINEAYDEYIKPFVDETTVAISNLVGTVTKGYNTYIAPVLKKVADLLKPFVEKYVSPLVKAVLDGIGEIIGIISLLLNNVLIPLIGWIVKNVMPIVAPLIEGLCERMLGLGEFIATIITGIIEVIDALLHFVNTGFREGWTKAWEDLKQTFSDIWDSMVDKIKGAINLMIDGVNTMINAVGKAINFVIDGLNTISFDVPWYVPVVGGQHWGFNISHVSMPNIPHLAEGAVIHGGNPFLAMLGDQPAGQTNIEAPLSTITEAMQAANSEEMVILREQNDLLREILSKKWISSRDVFNAARSENAAFVKRNGYSAFGY